MTPSAERAAGRAAARRRAASLAPLALALLAAAVAFRHRDALLEAFTAAASSPETQVRAALARQGRAAVDGVGAGGRAELSPVRFGDVAVQLDGERARVLAVVEGQGQVAWEGERVALGYVGREAFAMVRCPAARWCPDGAQLPALQGVLSALRGRADAARPALRVRAWQIRVERDRATAGEDQEVAASTGAAGPERRRAVYTLRRAGEGWVFVDGT